MLAFMKNLRVPKIWISLSTVAFFSIAILASQNPVGGSTWDATLTYMLTLMGALGLIMVIVQRIVALRSRQALQREDAEKPDLE